MNTPTPSTVAFAIQARRVSERLDRIGVVSPARKAQARRNGYKGIVTRNQLASTVRSH